jgi:hypothetical protein
VQVHDNDPETNRPKSLLTRIREQVRAWVARHIVADDPYEREDLRQVGEEERVPFWMGVRLAIMLLSAIISITGLIMLWRWLAGCLASVASS